MSNLSIFFTAIALSMDAFAVSLCKGLSLKEVRLSNFVRVGIWFGLFQGLMPLFGYLLSYKFDSLIVSINHYIAFSLLILLGINMIVESFSKEEQKIDSSLTFKTMFALAIATSIDALAVGVSFAFLDVNIIYSVTIISIITFILSSIGVFIGNKVGQKYNNKATLFGGIILIIIGIKTLI